VAYFQIASHRGRAISNRMNLSRISIPAGRVTVSGLTYTPDAAPRLCVVLAHGYTSSKASMDILAAYLCGRGYGCVTFDFRGHKLGGSTGTLDSMADAIEDLRSAAQFGMGHFGLHSCVLVGHSMGALVGFGVAADDPRVAAVAAIATGPKPSAAFTSVAGAAMLAQRAAYVDGAEPQRLLEQMDVLADAVERFGNRPALFVAARGDVLVRADRLREMALRAGPRAEFVEIDGSHLEAPDRARGAVANWLDRWAQ